MLKSADICKHCGLPAPDGTAGDFCCPGCESAWNIIHRFGLEDYYARRSGVYTTRIGGNVSVIEELFSECVKDSEKGAKIASFYITSIRCAACVWLVENIVSRLQGVRYVRVNYATYRTVVTFDPTETSLKNILEHIAYAGYPPVPENLAYTDSEKKDIFLRFAVGAFFSMQLMLYSVALYAGYFQDMPLSMKHAMQFISWAVSTPVLFYTGFPFIRNSIMALYRRHLSMDVLVTLGAGSAYLYSIAVIFTGGETYFDTSATILTLITLGKYIELSVKQRARSGLLSLFSLTPPFARKSDGKGGFAVAPLFSIKPGDKLQILPGDRIPADGVVLSGFAGVDESMLNGEPEPKSKQAGDKVLAGAMCMDGQLLIAAESVGKGTVLSQITDAIESAGISKTKAINTVDKISSLFIPFVLTVAIVTFTLHFFSGYGTGISITRAVSVLVVACPCAMGLAVPLAITAAFSRAASLGAVVKNGDLFETLTKCSCFCFDKTGTLTEGRPTVESYRTALNPELFLTLSARIEKYSGHLLARGISEFWQTDNLSVESFQEVAGHGVSGYVGGVHTAVGKYSFVKEFISETANKTELNLTEEMFEVASTGKSTVSVVIDGVFAGFYVMSDRLRGDALQSVTDLKNKYKVMLLSGDNRATVSANARLLGGIEYEGEQTPSEKMEMVANLRQNGECVVMVGDGINDAPALKQADGSIAVGKSLTDIAIDSADAVLTRHDLSVIGHLIMLSKQTRRIIKENLVWAFAYNVAAIPFAAAGIIHPVASAVSMSASSLIVILNSARVNKRNF
ncbi:MAG: heavy metal translocating P-type ATPase [Deferribacteraceae bacterium]|jgi:heavy metal translocating P-type ATPase|nr:heavy metal translocating P-type ATPase [Deferribacteraceae bacterium]